MEKIKDFFYYVGDFIVCILILSAMYFLITWKLEETMPIETEGAEKIAMESIDEEIDKDREKEKDKKSVLETGLEKNKDREERKNSAVEENKDKNQISKPSSENEKKDTSSENKDKKNSNTGDKSRDRAKKVTFTVSIGMNAWDIASSLKEKGVIDNADAFLAKLEEMGLSSSLLAGEFPLETGMDNETIIGILTGQN